MADVRIQRDLRIPMRDGIHLAAGGARPLPGAGGPAVTFFEQLGDGWRTAERWPPATAAPREFFAGADGALSTHPALEGEDVYRVDPTVGLAALPWDWTTPTPATPPDISPEHPTPSSTRRMVTRTDPTR
jgi:predicted acyl esterase